MGTHNIILKVSLPNQPNCPGEHKQTIKITDLHNLIYFLLGEHCTTNKQIQEKRTDTPIHIQDEVVRLRECVLLNLECIFQVLDRREECPPIFVQKLHPLVFVVRTLYSVEKKTMDILFRKLVYIKSTSEPQR